MDREDYPKYYNQDLIGGYSDEKWSMHLILQEGYSEDQLQRQLELVEKQRQESKVKIEQLHTQSVMWEKTVSATKKLPEC